MQKNGQHFEEVNQLDPEIKPVYRKQAESFYRVMCEKNFNVSEIADVLNHMGKMLVAHAEEIDKANAKAADLRR